MSWAHLKGSWGSLGGFWGGLGAVAVGLGVVLGGLEAFLGGPGEVLAGLVAILGRHFHQSNLRSFLGMILVIAFADVGRQKCTQRGASGSPKPTQIGPKTSTNLR